MATRQELFTMWSSLNTACSEVLDVLDSMKQTDREWFQKSELWDALKSIDNATKAIKTKLNLLNEEHADGAATVPVADEREQQDRREAEQIVSDELADYAREKGRM